MSNWWRMKCRSDTEEWIYTLIGQSFFSPRMRLFETVTAVLVPSLTLLTRTKEIQTSSNNTIVRPVLMLKHIVDLSLLQGQTIQSIATFLWPIGASSWWLRSRLSSWIQMLFCVRNKYKTTSQLWARNKGTLWANNWRVYYKTVLEIYFDSGSQSSIVLPRALCKTLVFRVLWNHSGIVTLIKLQFLALKLTSWVIFTAYRPCNWCVPLWFVQFSRTAALNGRKRGKARDTRVASLRSSRQTLVLHCQERN